MRHRRHVFVCTQMRPDGGKPACGARGGVDLVATLQRDVSTRADLVGAIAVTPCGCLGPCFDGPNLVVYPDGEWLCGVGEADIPDVIAYIAGGELPARLRYDGLDDVDQ